MESVPSPHFGCFTLPKASTAGAVFISDIGSDGQRSRARKAHTKSRRGCKNCKTRKIKCDERKPCQNCVKRNQDCVFATSPKLPSSMVQTRRPIQESPSSSSVIPDSPSSIINLEHLRLLHHFQTSTFETFIMEPETWKDSVIALAVENKFLMHAIFLVTATHLQHLQPDERGHQLVALDHLSQALPMFRKTLCEASDFRGSRGEAVIACSMLLLQYSWTYDSDGWDCLMAFYKGMMNVVLEFIKSWGVTNRVDGLGMSNRFTSLLLYSPRMHIEAYFKDVAIPSGIQAIFAHVLTCTQISDTQPDDENGFMEPSKRLMAILAALQLNRQELEASGLMLDVARYLFSFPTLLPIGFVDMLKKEDERAQVIVLYYMAAVSRLAPGRFWWMRERGFYMYEMVLQNLGNKCTECTRHVAEILEGRDSD